MLWPEMQMHLTNRALRTYREMILLEDARLPSDENGRCHTARGPWLSLFSAAEPDAAKRVISIGRSCPDLRETDGCLVWNNIICNRRRF